jgi:hypothetical protein
MPISQKQYPMRFTPKGLADAFDSTDVFPGACVELSNLVFNQGNPEIVISRPGVETMTAFPGFLNPGFVSIHQTIGDVVYGMLSTTLNAGKDEPFAYDHSTDTFIPITGVLNANTPTSPASTGEWTPPTMAAVGTKIIFTHPGFPGGATKFGVLDISNPAAPTWSAGDTTTNGLTATPIAVANFNNRAYFAVENRLEYTDVLSLARTSTSQSETLGDTTHITALAGLPIQTTSSGVIAALIAFKSFQTWQITGDPALTPSTLAQNYLSLTVGTQAPRSVAQSPLGLYFASNSGPKVIDQFAIVKSLTHSQNETDPDVQLPWQNMVVPSRVAGSYSNDVYRLCMQTILSNTDTTNDYWFDEHKRRWNGPHTFEYDCASQHDDHFIISSASNPGMLFHSRAFPVTSTVYTDLGVSFETAMQPSTFPKTGHMTMKQVVESTIELASSGGAAAYSITAIDDQGNTLNNCNVNVLSAGSLWGSGTWGGFPWAATNNKPSVYNIPWTAPLVFKKMAFLITATATAALSYGTFFARYQDTGYTNSK